MLHEGGFYSEKQEFIFLTANVLYRRSGSYGSGMVVRISEVLARNTEHGLHAWDTTAASATDDVSVKLGFHTETFS